MIYFDAAATSFYKPDIVKKSVVQAMNELTANPGRSGHILSAKASEMVFNTREKVKEFLHAEHYDVIFTKNCTEALNLAIFGTLNKGDHVISTSYEHNSVLRPLFRLNELGVESTILDCDMKDLPAEIEKAIKPNTKLIIVTATSNVTGEVSDFSIIGEIAKHHGIRFLVDGAQSSGHMEINLENSNVDMYAFAGHKGFGAITGVGGLVVKQGITLKPIMYGGTGTDSINLNQPTDSIEGYEAGTIPTIPIASLGAGVDFLTKNFENILKIETFLSKKMYYSLKNLDFIKLYSKESSRNVFSFNVLDYDSSLVADILNEDFNICVRPGLHCAPLIHKKLGTNQTGAIRVSLDHNNSEKEIDYLILALKQIVNY